jgi:hypothetical protein
MVDGADLSTDAPVIPPPQPKEKHNFEPTTTLPNFSARILRLGIFFAGDWLLAGQQ